MKLVREFPLRMIRTAREYASAAEMIDRLAVQPEGSLTAGEQDYLDALTLLVAAYDEEHFELAARKVRPIDFLKYLMNERGMNTADLGRLLGNRGLASLILNEKRELSKTHIRVLADHFNVEPGLFLEA
jgi:HTH-type transcriptional regulator / antitoxin HigA